MMQFDIRIPVITLRIVLIIFTVLSISIGGLLPFSFLSFNYFYNYMIPVPTIQLPFSQYILNYDFKETPPFIIISKELESIYGNQPKNNNNNEPYPFDDFQNDLNYDFKLLFNAYCQNSFNDYEPLMYKITIVTDYLVNQLSPYGTRSYINKRFHLWPITNNIHQLHNPHVLVSNMNSIVLRCGEQESAHSSKLESLVPPFLKWFIPPIVSEYEYSKEDPRHKVDLFKDINFESHINSENTEHFTNIKNLNIIVEFNRPDIIIDPSTSEILITASWKGIRYYLYHYRTISYILGTFILWTVSSDVLFLTVGLLILVRELRSQAQEVLDQDDTEMIDDDDLTIRPGGKSAGSGFDDTGVATYGTDPITLNRGGSSGEFYGTDESTGIDFRMEVHETDDRIEQSSQISSEITASTP